MANYASTVLLDALSEITDTAQKDLRAPQYGATRMFNDHKREVILNFDQFKNIEIKSDLQTAKVDYIKRSSRSTSSSRSAAPSGAMGDSGRQTLSFVTYADSFTISDDNVRNNRYEAAKILAAQIRNARLNIGADIETAMVAALEAGRSTTQGVRSLSTWDGVNNIMVTSNANDANYYNYMETDLKALNYFGRLQEVHSYNLHALAMEQTAQGSANSTNLQFQYGDIDFYNSSSITNSTDHFGTSYVSEIGALGLVDWIPGKNRTGLMGHADFDFMSVPDPFGVFDQFAVAVYKKVQDSTSGDADIGGTTQDAVWIYEWSIDVAPFITPITSDKAVYKYALSKS